MLIPWQALEPDTLNNLIEYFVLREGTDYGEQEVSLADKVGQVRAQLERGEVLLQFSELHDSVTLITRDELRRTSDTTSD